MKKIVLVLILGLSIAFVNAQNKKTAKPVKVKKTTVKVAELQKPITDNITKDFPGYKALEAYKLDAKGSISYQVEVKKDTSDINLFYSKNGVFLRKEKALKNAAPANTKQTKEDKNAKPANDNKKATPRK